MDEALKQYLTLGRGYFEKKQYAQAEKYLTQVVEENQSFADVYNMLGIVYHDEGQFARAQRAFEAALRINPAYTDAALNLAVIYNDMGKYREAKEVYQAALTRQRNSPSKIDSYVKGKIANMYADIGDVYSSSGLVDEAITEYRRALGLGPTFCDVRLKLADALRDKGLHEEAIREFEEIVKTNPNYLPGRVHFGITLYSAGRKADAIRVWEEVLSRNPGNKSAEMYLKLVRDTGQETGKGIPIVSEGGYALKFISGKYQGGEFPLKHDRPVVIGRSSELDMVLVEDMVSRKHAKISWQQGKPLIEDLGSTNGTFVNGEKVKQSRLKEGDRILIGTSILKLVRGSTTGELSDVQVKQQLEQVAAVQSARQTKTAMTGKLDEVPLPDLLQLFHTSKKNGVLVVTNEHEARIYLRQGKVYYAVIDENHELGPQKSFNRIIHWELGDFELRPPDSQQFMVELDASTEGLLMDALREFDELRRIQGQLPSPDQTITLAVPMTPPLRELSADELDVLQLLINWGTLQGVLDHSLKDDLTAAQMLVSLMQRDYARIA